MTEEIEVQGRKYTVEFKQRAVELANSLGSATKAADQLGIPDVNIHKWRKTLSEPSASAGDVQQENALEELKRQ